MTYNLRKTVFNARGKEPQQLCHFMRPMTIGQTNDLNDVSAPFEPHLNDFSEFMEFEPEAGALIELFPGLFCIFPLFLCVFTSTSQSLQIGDLYQLTSISSGYVFSKNNLL